MSLASHRRDVDFCSVLQKKFRMKCLEGILGLIGWIGLNGGDSNESLAIYILKKYSNYVRVLDIKAFCNHRSFKGDVQQTVSWSRL